jgi:hypothetical protein
MAAEPGRVLGQLSDASAAKWSVIDRVVHEKDWRPFIKLLAILLVVQVTSICTLLWAVLR